MSLPVYALKINGRYFAGFDESKTQGKSSGDGWYSQANELSELVLADEMEKAKLVDGNINLNSVFKSIYERVRYGGLTLESLEIRKVGEE